MYKILKSKLFNSSLVYGGFSLLNSFIPFLLLPVLTRRLSPEDYGILSIFVVLLAFMTPVVGFSTMGSVSRQYFKKDQIKLSSYIGNCILVLLFSSFIVFFILLFFSRSISQLTKFPEKWLIVVLLCAMFNYITSLMATIWQISQKPHFYGLFQIGQTLINLSLSLFFIFYIDLNWEGRILGQLITYLIFGLLALLFLVRGGYLDFHFNYQYVKLALIFGLPLIIHSLSGTVMTLTDRFFITKKSGLSEAGLYSVAYSLGGIIAIIEYSFNLAFAPWLFEQLSKLNERIKLRIVRIIYFYFVFLIIFSLIYSLILYFILDFIVGEKFLGTGKFILWITLSFAFVGMYKMVVNFIFYIENTRALSLISFSAAILNLFFNYLLVDLFGALGAAYSAFLTSFYLFISTWILSIKLFPMPWFEFYRIFRIHNK